MLYSIDVACPCGTSIKVDTDREKGHFSCPRCSKPVSYGEESAAVVS